METEFCSYRERCLIIVFVLLVFLASCAPAGAIRPLASPTPNSFFKTFTPTISLAGLSLETSGAVESITVKDGVWVVTAGGVSAFTHYARLRYKLPEQEGVAPTTFYMKSVVILPPDFYTRQTAGFRIMNTDNFGTTVNGVHYGASDINELRTAVWFFSDHKIRIRTEHETVSKELLYTAPTQLPVGEHVFEFYGDVANVAPWWFKIDGIVVASGNARLSPDSVPVEERVITRLTTGIMGAADLSNNSMTVKIREFVVANYDPYAVTPSPTPTGTPTNAPTSTITPVPTVCETAVTDSFKITVCTK